MEPLRLCSGCGGFVGAAGGPCPHCGASTPRRRRRWAVALGLVGSATLGLTMTACYGAPPCEPGPNNGCKDPHDATSQPPAQTSAQTANDALPGK